MSLRCNGHLRSWIKVNKIKGEFSNDMLSECMESILNLYGSHKDLLNFLIINSPKQPLDEMYKVLQKTLEIHKMKSMNDINPNAISIKNNNKPLKMDINRISTTSIETICGFLKRKQIERFKPCNRAIAIICLNEMMKSSITICHATQLLNTKLKPCARSLMLLRHNPSHFVKYNANATYPFILPDNVRNSSQIPIAIDRERTHHLVSNQKIYPKSSLIIFDKSDITHIESNNSNFRPMASNDAFVDGEHIILALHYFNVRKQEFRLIKYLMIDPQLTLQHLIHYVTTTLVPNNTDGTFDDLDALATSEKKMNALRFSFMDKRGTQTYCLDMYDPIQFNECLKGFFRNQKIVSVAFQANIAVDKAHKFEFEVTTLTRFYRNSKSLSLRTEAKCLRIKRNKSCVQELQQQMKHCMTLNHQSQQQISDVMESLGALEKGISIRYDDYLGQDILQHYISRNLFHNMVDAKNISLPNFRLVPYDTCTNSLTRVYTYRKDDHINYSIRLFDESQAPFPFHCNEIARDPICIDIRSKKRCSPADMICQLKQIAKDPVFNYKFKSIEATLKKYGTQFTCYAVKDLWRYERTDSDSDEDEYSMYGPEEDTFHKSYSVLFEQDDSIHHYEPMYRYQSDLRSVSIYLVPKWYSPKCATANKEQYDMSRMMVRFAWSGSIDCEMGHMHNLRKHLIGLPLIVWITHNDSLQDIIKNNPTMQQLNDIVVETFVVHENKFTRLIQRSERNKTRFSDYDAEFVIVTLRKSTDNSVHQHSLSGYRPFVLDRFDEYRDW
eukprot:987322_1